MHATDFGIDNFSTYLNLVDEKIRSIVSEEIPGLSRILSVNGKRLRPGLVLAVIHFSGKEINEKVINAATAVELVHLASLVHDDAMDGGTVRHGEPTISSVEGVGAAIVAGDYLLAKATSIACSVSIEVGYVVSEAIADLCVGQARELADNFNLERTQDALLSAVRGKTSVLFVVSCVLGGMVSGLPAEQIKMLSEFAENFGIAYQYLDDIGDFTEPSEGSDKSFGGDVREGNYTLPVIFSLQGSQGLRLKGLLEDSDVSAPQVLEILLYDGSIDRAMKEAEKYVAKALSALNELENHELAAALTSFVRQLQPTEVSKK